jgi:hypothetical protein
MTSCMYQEKLVDILRRKKMDKKNLCFLTWKYVEREKNIIQSSFRKKKKEGEKRGEEEKRKMKNRLFGLKFFLSFFLFLLS